MADPSISFRLQAVTGRGLLGQRRHDLRIGRQPAYVDPERHDQNRQIFRSTGFGLDDNAMAFVQRSRNEIEARAKRKTTAGKYWRTAILTFSKEAQARLADQGTEPHAEAERAFRDFADRHGIRLLSVDFHGDESAPHYHASFEGMTADGYALRLNRTQLSEEQDHFAGHFADHGLTRGKRRSERQADGEDPSKWVHRTVKELHEQLPADLAGARERLEQNQRRAAKAAANLEAGKGNLEKVRKNLATYERRAAEAAAEVQRLETTVQEAQRRAERATGAAQEAERQERVARARLEPLRAAVEAVGAWEARGQPEPTPDHYREAVARLRLDNKRLAPENEDQLVAQSLAVLAAVDPRFREATQLSGDFGTDLEALAKDSARLAAGSRTFALHTDRSAWQAFEAALGQLEPQLQQDQATGRMTVTSKARRSLGERLARWIEQAVEVVATFIAKQAAPAPEEPPEEARSFLDMPEKDQAMVRNAFRPLPEPD